MGQQDARDKRVEAEAATSTADIVVAEADIVTLQADVVTAEADIDTAEADIVTLQGRRVRKASLTVGFAALTDSDGAQTFAFGAALPADAIILAVGLDVTAGFTDGASGVFTADLGINGGDIDAFLDGADIASIDDVASPQGIQPTGRVGAITPALTILADVNVDTATVGAVTAEVLYVDGDNLD